MLAVALSLVLFGAGLVLCLQWAFAHDSYHQWFGADGGRCCSDLGRECRPVRSYFDPELGAFLILLGGRWRPVAAGAGERRAAVPLARWLKPCLHREGRHHLLLRQRRAEILKLLTCAIAQSEITAGLKLRR